MPIDASIYGQFAPKVQNPLDVQNALTQTAANGLAMQHQRMQMQQLSADMADTQALRDAYRGGADPTTPEGRAAIIRAAPLQAPKILQAGADYNKSVAETNKFNAQASKADAEIPGITLKQATDRTAALAARWGSVKSPEDVIPLYQQAVKDGLMKPEDAITEIQKTPTDASFADYAKTQFAKGQTLAQQLEAQQKTAQLASEEKRTGMTNATSLATNAATNATHLQGIGIQQGGENQRAALGRQTQLAIAGVGPDGTLGPDQQALIDAIGTYKVQPPTGMALRNPRMQSILAQVAQKYPDFDATQYGARQVAAKSFATGKDGQAIQSANTALNHLDTISQLAAAQKNGDIRLFNQIANRIATETGGTAPTNLQSAVTMVGPEISKAVIGAGGGQGDRDKVDAALASLVKGGPAQAEGTVATMKDLFGGRLTESERTYKRTTGRDDFANTFLSPAAQGVLAAKKGAAAPGAGHPPEINDLLKKYGK